MPAVTLYSKPNCPLCDEALEQIAEARKTVPFDFTEVNILADEALYHQHRHHIPVVQLDGREVFRFRLTAEELVRILRAGGLIGPVFPA